MSIHLREQPGSNILEVRAQGRLTHRDYLQLVPRTKRMIQDYGKVRVLFEMSAFDGWSWGALWDDVKFDLTHFKDVERIALVGEPSCEDGMEAFRHPFTSAEVRYFHRGQHPEARQWLESARQVQSA